jgi:quinol monooxygenase YgiN
MAIYKTERFKVRPESIDRCKQAIHEFIAQVRLHEPGTIYYESWQEVDDPTSFVHFFVFENAWAEEKHRTSDWVKRFTDVLYPETITPPDFMDYHQVATTEQ